MPSRPASPTGPRWRTSRCRTAAGLVTAVALLTGPTVLPAAAEGEDGGAGGGAAFDSSDCQSFEVTPPIQSWAVDRLAPERVRELATGKGVTIAVIDTGVQVDLPALADASVSAINFAGYDQQVAAGTDLRDCQHGTQVTSLIVGAEGLDDRTNFVGMAPDATVIAMRSLQRGPGQVVDGVQEETDPEPLSPTVQAVRAAIAQDVDIINISQTTPSSAASYREAIEDAVAAGIVVVAAAGNRPGDPRPYPAGYSGVISVGATTRTDQPAEFSQSHEDLEITVAAPGELVLVPNPRQAEGLSWMTVNGTSFAAPQVSGVVALLLEREPDLTPAEVEERLQRTADPVAAGVPDDQLGWGVVNPLHALTDSVGEQVPAPGPVATPTPAEDYRDRPPPDNTLRNVAIGLAGGAVLVVAVAAVLAASLPAGRRRRWRPAGGDRTPR